MMDTGKKIKDELSLESVSIAQPSTAANLFAYDDSSPSSTMSDDEDDESCTTDIDDVVFPLSGASTDIEAEIARDLNEISLKEREDTLYDIHGVADVIEEEPKFINDALRELDSWLSKKRRNTKISKAYEIAAAQSPVFVERKGFRLMFLRANRFNSQAAATQMLKHFEVKLDLFGAELLCKDIRIADLNEEGSESLRQLKLTFLPKRDSAGRLVVVIIEHLASHCSIKSMTQAFWYLFMAKLDDEVNQKKGIVVVVYMLKLKKDPITGYSSTCTALNFGKARIALPFRVGAIHGCVNDVASRAALAIVRNLPIMPKEERRRMRVHTGKHSECMFGIMTHGIPISDFPVRNDGSVDRESHNTLIETRKELESEPWTKTKAIVPMSTDVLLGRGRGVQYHEGNVGLRVVMERYLAEYDQSQRKDRKEVASKVVDEVQRKGGRFLQKANSAWQEVNDKQVATKKVMHGFRDMRKLKSHSFESLEQDSSKDEDATRKRPLDVFSC